VCQFAFITSELPQLVVKSASKKNISKIRSEDGCGNATGMFYSLLLLDLPLVRNRITRKIEWALAN